MKTYAKLAFGLGFLPVALFAGTAMAAPHFAITNLVSDQAGVAAHTDPDLVNAWGISHARAVRCGSPTTGPTGPQSTTPAATSSSL